MQFKKAGLTTGYLQFSLVGGNESRGGVMAAQVDENTFVYANAVDTPRVELIKVYIEERMMERSRPREATTSLAGDLAQLADLHAKGLLTDTEFSSAKERLLGGRSRQGPPTPAGPPAKVKPVEDDNITPDLIATARQRDQAAVTQGRGYTLGRLARMAALVVVGSAIVIAVMVVVDSSGLPSRPVSTAPGRSELPIAAAPASSSGLTLANYQRIATGMTYSEVVQILGSQGEEMSRVDLAGMTTVMYGWSLWTGANMNAMFQDGRLIQKAQFGLK